MTSNAGKIDKAVRLFPAPVMGALVFYFKSWWGPVAIVPLVTCLASFGLLYTSLGLNTSPVKSVQ